MAEKAIQNNYAIKFRELSIMVICLSLAAAFCCEVFVEQKSFLERQWITLVSGGIGGIIGYAIAACGAVLTCFLSICGVTTWFAIKGIMWVFIGAFSLGGTASILSNILSNPNHYNYNWVGIVIIMALALAIGLKINYKLSPV